MKHLIRRLSRVADSSSTKYCLLRSGISHSSQLQTQKSFRRLTTGKPRSRKSSIGSVPSGHLPVYVGEEMERFIVSAKILNHPIFVQLLNKSAQVYGYEQKGALRIPCHVAVFESLLDVICRGDEVSMDVYDEIINSSTSTTTTEELFL